MSGLLPEGFGQLEPFLGWALPTERARHAKAEASSMAEAQAFYDAMLPLPLSASVPPLMVVAPL